jgi:hypothetical protein
MSQARLEIPVKTFLEKENVLDGAECILRRSGLK